MWRIAGILTRVSESFDNHAIRQRPQLEPEHGQKVRALGRVVRTEEGEGGTKLLAVSIVDISGRAHLALKQYLRDQEE